MDNTTDIKQDFSHIKGWGIDADPKNDPTYPMKNRKIAIKRGYSWNRPEQQPINQEVLHSIERPNVTAVFGTSVPLSGLSGAIRRFAFKHSENSYLHWLPLIMADRVNVVEGLVDDFSKGTVPNIFAERGWKAKWKHNPDGLILDAVVATAVITALITIAVKGRKDAMHDLGDLVSDAAHGLEDVVSSKSDDIGKEVKDKAKAAKEKSKSLFEDAKEGTKKMVEEAKPNGSTKRSFFGRRSKKYVPQEKIETEVRYMPVEPVHVVKEPVTHQDDEDSGFLSNLLSALVPAFIKKSTT